jgi:tetratricopeptide (TPR) repeat protein
VALAAARENKEGALQLVLEALTAKGVMSQRDELCEELGRMALQPDKRDRRPDLLKTLDEVLPKLSQPSEHKTNATCYAAYLHGLTHHDERKFAEAAENMVKAYPPDTPAAALTSPDRQKEAAKVLSDAAQSLPRGESPLEPFAPAEADKIYRWLKTATELLTLAKDEVPVSTRADLALAAGFKHEPDAKLARQLLDKLFTQPGASELSPQILSLLLVKAQVADRPAGSIAAFAKMLAPEHKTAWEAIPAKDRFTMVLGPAIKLGDSLPAQALEAAETKATLARCYAAYARLVSEHKYDEWTPKPPEQVAFEYYDQAVKLDDRKPRYLIGRGYSRTAVAKPDLKAAEADARQVLTGTQNQNAGAHGLLGFVHLLQARQGPEGKPRLAKLQAAADAIDQALRLAKDGEEEGKATFLLNRSIVCLELGNATDRANRKALKTHFHAAQEFAMQAAAEKSYPYPALVLEAWGNALEDLAMFLGEKEAYAQAIAKFSEAIKRSSIEAAFWVDRGRCRFRWVALGGHADATVLDKALSDLDEAISLGEDSAEGAQAHYWKGAIYRSRLDPAQARAELAKAVKLGEDHDGRAWAEFARKDLAQMQLDELRPLLQRQPAQAAAKADEVAGQVAANLKDYGSQGRPLLVEVYRFKADAGFFEVSRTKGAARANALSAVRTAADKIEAYGDSVQAAYVRGQAYEWEENVPAALKTYSDALEPYPEAPKKNQARLLYLRTKLRLDHGIEAPRKDMLKDLSLALDAIEEDRDKVGVLYLTAVVNSSGARDVAENDTARKKYLANAIQAAEHGVALAANTQKEWPQLRLVLAMDLFLQAKATTKYPDKLPLLTKALKLAQEASGRQHLLRTDERTQMEGLLKRLRKEKQLVSDKIAAGG